MPACSLVLAFMMTPIRAVMKSYFSIHEQHIRIVSVRQTRLVEASGALGCGMRGIALPDLGIGGEAPRFS